MVCLIHFLPVSWFRVKSLSESQSVHSGAVWDHLKCTEEEKSSGFSSWCMWKAVKDLHSSSGLLYILVFVHVDIIIFFIIIINSHNKFKSVDWSDVGQIFSVLIWMLVWFILFSKIHYNQVLKPPGRGIQVLGVNFKKIMIFTKIHDPSVFKKKKKNHKMAPEHHWSLSPHFTTGLRDLIENSVSFLFCNSEILL